MLEWDRSISFSLFLNNFSKYFNIFFIEPEGDVSHDNHFLFSYLLQQTAQPVKVFFIDGLKLEPIPVFAPAFPGSQITPDDFCDGLYGDSIGKEKFQLKRLAYIEVFVAVDPDTPDTEVYDLAFWCGMIGDTIKDRS